MHQKGNRLLGQEIKSNKGLFICAGICTLLVVAADYITPLLLAETLDYYLCGKPSTFPTFINHLVDVWGGRAFMAENLWIAGIALVTVNLIGGFFNFVRRRVQSLAGEGIAKDLRDRLYTHIQRLPFDYHVKAETGDLVQRCTTDVETVRRFLSGQLTEMLNSVVMIITAVTVMFGKNTRLAWLSVVMLPGLFGFSYLFFKWIVAAFTASDEADGKMSSTLQENLTGVRVVRAFGQEKREIDQFKRVTEDQRTKDFKLTKLLAVYWSTSDAMCMIQSAITLLLCVAAAAKGEITVGTMVIFTTYVGKLCWPIRQMGRLLSDAGKAAVAGERIADVLAEKEEPEEPEAIKPPLSGDIVFENVHFGYDGQQELLKGLSMTIPAGKTVAILGATGSGKSSLVNLLQRLYAPTDGKITIGGTDLQKIDRRYLRSRVGLILQEPFLYSKTLKENIGIVLKDANFEQVKAAAADACALQFIEESENGWDTLVGERGVTLSGGQKQRAAIARTLLKDNDILIFDDSLSAVDTETDAAIRHALRERKKNVTTVIISHRIVTLSQADLIFVLENGVITQQGNHRELIGQDGLYKRIFGIQTALEEEFNGTEAK